MTTENDLSTGGNNQCPTFTTNPESGKLEMLNFGCEEYKSESSSYIGSENNDIYSDYLRQSLKDDDGTVKDSASM